MPNKECPQCKARFDCKNNAQVYCTLECRTARQKTVIDAKPNWKTELVSCGVCGTIFSRGENSSPIRKYCSDECILKSVQLATGKFKNMNPTAMRQYNLNRNAKYGTDNMSNRLYKKYPDLPRVCEVPGCGENRVIDFAHKPEFERKGAHRVMRFYERHMFWVLCPTHHAVIDRGAETPEQLGLV